MNEAQTNDTAPMDLNNVGVPAVIASLEMLTVDTKASQSMENKRERVTKRISTEVSNRRYNLRPKKRTFFEINNPEEHVKEYYLDKKVKRKSNNLETIYEESNDTRDSATHMSIKRFKRMLLFKSEPTASKLKKRRARIQKIFGSKVCYEKRCASMQTLLDKLDGIRANSPMKVNND